MQVWSITRSMCYHSVMENMTEKTFVNVYDFDKTIYDGDSTFDLYKYCLRRYPKIIWRWPALVLRAILFGLGVLPKTEFKEKFYRFLRDIPDIEQTVEDFWIEGKKKIKPWYLEQKKDTDIISSASPEFNLKGICDELGVRMIGSIVDPKTGVHTGLNNHGEEKVVRLKKAYPNVSINQFYSDSLSDTPLALLAKKSFLVKGNEISDWPK